MVASNADGVRKYCDF